MTSGDAPVFDRQALLARLSGNAQLAERLLALFGANHADFIAKIRVRIADGDTAGAARACHELRGTAVTLSAEALAHAAGALEQALLGHRADEFEPLVARLDEVLAATLTAFGP